MDFSPLPSHLQSANSELKFVPVDLVGLTWFHVVQSVNQLFVQCEISQCYNVTSLLTSHYPVDWYNLLMSYIPSLMYVLPGSQYSLHKGDGHHCCHCGSVVG